MTTEIRQYDFEDKKGESAVRAVSKNSSNLKMLLQKRNVSISSS